jgi:hypothetical protein
MQLQEWYLGKGVDPYLRVYLSASTIRSKETTITGLQLSTILSRHEGLEHLRPNVSR